MTMYGPLVLSPSHRPVHQHGSRCCPPTRFWPATSQPQFQSGCCRVNFPHERVLFTSSSWSHPMPGSCYCSVSVKVLTCVRSCHAVRSFWKPPPHAQTCRNSQMLQAFKKHTASLRATPVCQKPHSRAVQPWWTHPIPTTTTAAANPEQTPSTRQTWHTTRTHSSKTR